MANIKELLNSGAQTILAVTPAELKEFAVAIIEGQKEISEEQPKQDRMLCQRDVAKMLGVTSTTLWRWKNNGSLTPTSKIGRKVMYAESKVQAMLKGEES